MQGHTVGNTDNTGRRNRKRKKRNVSPTKIHAPEGEKGSKSVSPQSSEKYYEQREGVGSRAKDNRLRETIDKGNAR